MSQITMKQLQALLLLVLNAGTLLISAHPPRCNDNDEDCRDAHMHPILPSLHVKHHHPAKDDETKSSYWLAAGEAYVAQQQAAADDVQRGVAKNVILFLGDGMSLATLTATRAYLGGQEKSLYFQRFPSTGLAKTYSLDFLVPDSACTGTAYLGGVKARVTTLGVNGHVLRNDCKATLNASYHVHSIAKWALDSGKEAGLVTTTRVTHASPAAVYAHVANRDWENDNEVMKTCGAKSGVADIAAQLMEGDVGKRLKVIMGGGKAHFIDAKHYKDGKRMDGRNYIEEYRKQNVRNAYVESKAELNALNVSATNRLLGLFHDDHLLYNLRALAEKKTQQPTLEEMTAKAIEVLTSNNEKGYFLFVEGGMIDTAHHENKARIALDETAEFSKAVQRAREMTDIKDTLIVVSSDHSHTMTMSGYAPRNNDIFGPSDVQADDGLAYLTLSYANGPSFDKYWVKNKGRIDPLKVIKNKYDDIFPAMLPAIIETHGGEDVAVFASGPWSHMFSGVYEQSTLPHLMGFAACLGNGLKACDKA